MTSTFTTVSSIGCIISKTRNPSAEGLSSFSSISSASLGGWKDKVVLQRRCTPKIQAAAKEIKFDGGAAAKNFGTGAKILADAVKNTLGTDGRNVAIESKFGSGKLEDYGATGGNDQIGQLGSDESYGAEMVSQSASKTTDLNGNEITEGVKVVAAGADPIQITRGIEKTAKALAVELKLISEEVQDSVGKKDVVKMQFDSGYISPYFVTNRNKMIVEYDNCKLLLVDKKISKAEDLAGVLEEATKGDYPIVIIAEDIEGEALASLVTSKIRSALKVAAVKAPWSGKLKSQYLDDIAILTGGTVIREEVVTTTSSVLGNAAKIVISEEKTTIVSDGSTNEEVDKRVDQLKNLVEAAELDSEKKQLNERIAKLNQVPAEEGIKVDGGSSSTLLRLSQKADSIKETLENDEQKVGADIVKRSLSYTMDLIAKNAGTEKVLPDENPIYGYNVATGKYEDPSTSFDIAMRSILHFLILNEQSMY